MHSVLALEGAVLLLFQALRSIALFFGRSIVTTFALRALHNYQFTSHFKHPTSLFVITTLSRTVALRRSGTGTSRESREHCYSITSETRPEATVRPPSRIAKRSPFSIAIGAISSTEMEVLSPGITISVPSARVIVPVTSVVRK